MCISLLYINRKERERTGSINPLSIQMFTKKNKYFRRREQVVFQHNIMTTKTIRLINNKLINIFETERKRK